MDIEQSVYCASGRTDYQTVHQWTRWARAMVVEPDTALSLSKCPADFRALDSKLGSALKGVIRACSDTALRQYLADELRRRSLRPASLA